MKLPFLTALAVAYPLGISNPAPQPVLCSALYMNFSDIGVKADAELFYDGKWAVHSFAQMAEVEKHTEQAFSSCIAAGLLAHRETLLRANDSSARLCPQLTYMETQKFLLRDPVAGPCERFFSHNGESI